jgi:hypothetical protein
MSDFTSLREKIAAETALRRERYAEFATAFEVARAKGVAAGEAAKPTPMVVYEADCFGRPKADGESWRESEGACGFAWIIVRPGNGSFAKWLMKNGHARRAYNGGVQIWISDHGQSVDRKVAHAYAMAAHLREALGVHAYPDSRLD